MTTNDGYSPDKNYLSKILEKVAAQIPLGIDNETMENEWLQIPDIGSPKARETLGILNYTVLEDGGILLQLDAGNTWVEIKIGPEGDLVSIKGKTL